MPSQELPAGHWAFGVLVCLDGDCQDQAFLGKFVSQVFPPACLFPCLPFLLAQLLVTLYLIL